MSDRILTEGMRVTVHRKLGTIVDVGEEIKINFDDGSKATFKPEEIKPLPNVPIKSVPSETKTTSAKKH